MCERFLPRALRIALLLTLVIAAILTRPLDAGDPDRDFSGKWLLDAGRSSVASLGQVETSLQVSQGGGGILCSTGGQQWSYALDGSETRKKLGEEYRTSVTKWEGAALLVNTQVSGPRNYTVMDRWELSRNRNTLTIARQIVDLRSETEGSLVFHREGVPIEQPAPASGGWRQTPPANPESQPVLAKRPQAAPPDIVVPTGTHVLLALIGEVNTKHAKEGDRVYLRTATPLAANGRVVIPRGSDVEGTITRTKPAGKVVGKGELYIRFDSLILPNGVSRDFRARPTGDEGKVEGGGKSADGRTVMEGAGIGATVGAITRGLGGAAVGGVGGALAGVLLSRDQNVVLRSGTHLEMVLDRDLVFHPDELP
ncbi:MAG TPA: hypothetical protein VMT86_15940 [Bryobacteraceae bacterium]|nr:hypothetical protein [Bryobacteraceae bacterium]